jgi:hypothetical protein
MDIKEVRPEGVEWSASEWGPLLVTRQVPEKAGNYVTNSATVTCSEVLSQRYQSKVHPCTGTEALYRPYDP